MRTLLVPDGFGVGGGGGGGGRGCGLEFSLIRILVVFGGTASARGHAIGRLLCLISIRKGLLE